MGSRGGGTKRNNFDYSFKILLVGDSGVGKSSLLLSFLNTSFVADPSPTIGVDFKVKLLNLGGRRLKLTVWDTAGQERFGIITSSYYRGAHGIILVYDVTRRVTFTNLSDIWAKEVDIFSPNQDFVKILVGNKADRVLLETRVAAKGMSWIVSEAQEAEGNPRVVPEVWVVAEYNSQVVPEDSERAVTTEEGTTLARDLKCSFLECSAKTRENVQQCFRELSLKILEVPSLLEKGSVVGKKQVLKQKQVYQSAHSGGCCSQ